jgi:predicted O-linked N-acetylglucosamine transferase (SPINDLY family)
LADGWRDFAGTGDEAVADLVREDRVDILADLPGHTAYNRLSVFARKPAPIQLTFLGRGTTTGLSAIDYRLTDRLLSPPDSPEWFSEGPFFLPACSHCYRPPDGAPRVTPLPASRSGHITFGSFNSHAKLNPSVIRTWARILQALPKGRLVLKDRTLADAAQQRSVFELFARRGLAAHRLTLLPQTGAHVDHLRLYAQIDIALDPFPYNGCTTTCEAIWMGVPVITLAGSMSFGRHGASLLPTLGLVTLVTSTPEAYVTQAVDLAARLDELAALRRTLRPQMAASPLCDADTFARNVEQAYRLMWRRWCQQGE